MDDMIASPDLDSNGGTTMNDLPTELLYEILKRNEGEYELNQAQEVCQRWYAVIDAWIGRTVHHPGCPRYSLKGLQEISKIGVNSLIIRDEETYNRILLNTPPSPQHSLKHPNMLKSFNCWGPIHPDLFLNLLRNSVNLAKLEVTSTVLSYVRNGDLAQLNFPSLKVFTLYHLIPSPSPLRGEPVIAPAFLPNLQTLLMPPTRFPRLTWLKIQFPVESANDFETLKVLIPFIRGHHHTLRKISVRMAFPENSDQTYPTTYQEDLKVMISRIRQFDGCPSLKKLTVVGTTTEGWLSASHPQLELWKEFAMKQTSLEELDLHIGPLTNEELGTLSFRNGPTLKKLTLTFGYAVVQAGVNQRRIDCSLFSHLKTLNTFSLCGDHQITGARHLSPTLEELRISGRFRSEELTHILLQLPNLRDIRLDLAGSPSPEEGYEISLDTLQQLIQSKRVQKLHISLNGTGNPVPSEGIPNGDPNNPKNLTVSSGRIWWELNEDGYYSAFQLVPLGRR